MSSHFSIRRVLRHVSTVADVIPPFPGRIAHHRAPGIRGLREGHAAAFHDMTVRRGLPASEFFTQSGIAATADANGGLCSFRFGKSVALYQSRNLALVDDDALAPSLDANRSLFGDFMGTLPNDDPRRDAKRRLVEATFGNTKYLKAVAGDVRRFARNAIERYVGVPTPLDEFAMEVIAYVDSSVPGLLDLKHKPLTDYLRSDEYGKLMRDFFDIASEVISKANPSALDQLESLGPLVRSILLDNFDSIAAAPPSNVIRQSFCLWGLRFDRDAIGALKASQLSELATLIVASYDTTSLSLLWAIAHVEADASVKRQLSEGATVSGSPFSTGELVALEAIRLAGSNPTALYRRVVRQFTLEHGGKSVIIPAGTLLWLDRRRANQDSLMFPNPCEFALENAASLARSERETVASVLSRGRYEINSFSMVNTHRNPRKCPGRLFSIRVQALVLEELYRNYVVSTSGVKLELREFSSMPRPRAPGTVRIVKKEA